MSKLSERESLLVEAKIAETAERYRDMADAMKQIVKHLYDGKQLNQEERNLFSVAFKNIVGAHRSAWRIVSAREQKTEDNEVKEVARVYRDIIEKELREICREVIKLLDDHLIVIKEDCEVEETVAIVFYLKMKGDYYRYLAEVTEAHERDQAIDNSCKVYEKACEYAKKLPATHPIRLGLALNFSVFCYEIMNLPEKACKTAKQAFDDAIKDTSNVLPDSNQDTTLIMMQLLRDNLTLWTSDIDDSQ